MKTRLIINGQEVTHRGQKFIILAGALLLTLLLSALILFVFLPLMGVIIAFSTAIFVISGVLLLVGVLFGIFGHLLMELLVFLQQIFMPKK